MNRVRAAVLLVLGAACGAAEERSIEAMATLNRVFSPPKDAALIDVRAFGGVGDGVADDTEAFAKAIAESAKTGFFRPFVFVPRGTWLVSATVTPGAGRFFTIVGEERDTTIIRLKDACPGFQDPAKPQAVLAIGGGPNNNQAFGNYVHNLTISTGRGNPGAAGLRFKASNYGATTELTIRSEDGAGVAGLLLDWADPGPEAHRNLHIIGFDHGVRSTNAMFGPVFENLLLEQQRQAGIHTTNNSLWLRRVLSRNRVPAIVQGRDRGNDTRGECSMIMLDASRCEGGAADAAAIVLEGGYAYVRDLAVAGYGSAIRPETGDPVKGPAVTRWTSHAVLAMPGASAGDPLRLPVQELPTPDYEPADRWTNVQAFADETTPTMGWTGALQRAIDSGATTLYLPKGKYTVTRTVHLRGKVRHIIGLNSLIDVDTDMLKGEPVFRFDGDQPELVIEHLHTTINDRDKRNLGTIAWQHAAKGRLVIQHSLTHGYRSQAGAGPLFAFDVCATNWLIDQPGQLAWLRSLNIEGYGGAKDLPGMLTVRGVSAWILGYKTEGGHVTIAAERGAQVELLGGFHYPAQGFKEQVPMYRIEDARAALTWSECAHGPKRWENRHKCQILEIRAGTPRELMLGAMPKDLQEGKFGRVVNVPLATVGP